MEILKTGSEATSSVDTGALGTTGNASIGGTLTSTGLITAKNGLTVAAANFKWCFNVAKSNNIKWRFDGGWYNNIK